MTDDQFQTYLSKIMITLSKKKDHGGQLSPKTLVVFFHLNNSLRVRSQILTRPCRFVSIQLKHDLLISAAAGLSSIDTFIQGRHHVEKDQRGGSLELSCEEGKIVTRTQYQEHGTQGLDNARRHPDRHDLAHRQQRQARRKGGRKNKLPITVAIKKIKNGKGRWSQSLDTSRLARPRCKKACDTSDPPSLLSTIFSSHRQT